VVINTIQREGDQKGGAEAVLSPRCENAFKGEDGHLYKPEDERDQQGGLLLMDKRQDEYSDQGEKEDE